MPLSPVVQRLEPPLINAFAISAFSRSIARCNGVHPFFVHICHVGTKFDKQLSYRRIRLLCGEYQQVRGHFMVGDRLGTSFQQLL